VFCKTFSTATLYCQSVPSPKSHVLFVLPSLNSFAPYTPAPTDTQYDGSVAIGARRLICALADVALKSIAVNRMYFFT
jgi:hypothetical protein